MHFMSGRESTIFSEIAPSPSPSLKLFIHPPRILQSLVRSGQCLLAHAHKLTTHGNLFILPGREHQGKRHGDLRLMRRVLYAQALHGLHLEPRTRGKATGGTCKEAFSRGLSPRYLV
eukprot:596922-Hanusia_phi.AAC.2